jgi:hypothetical protein
VLSVYWKNIPGKKNPDNLQFTKISLNKDYLLNYQKPFILFTGTNRPALKRIFLSEDVVKKLNAIGLDFFLYEPCCYYVNGQQHNRGFYSEIKYNTNINSIRSDELDKISRYAEKNKLTNVTVYTCDYNIEKLSNNYPNIKLVCKDIFLNFLDYADLSDVKKNIKKPFWCGTGRYTQHRHLVMSYLADKSGNYSWHFDCDFESTKDQSWLDLTKLPNDTIQTLRQGSEVLNREHFSLEIKTKKIRVEDHHGVYIPTGNFSILTKELQETYNESFVCIVNETRFAQPTANFSEKLIHAVINESPFILAAPPRTLEYFRSMGFKSFSDFWDESYDLEEDHTIRLNLIFKIIDQINSLSIEELTDLYKQMYPIILHNKQNLKNAQLKL